VIEVALTTTTLVAARPPMVTVQPAAKPVPVKVRAVADLVPPVAGATVVKVEVEAGTRPATAVSWLVTRVCSAVHLFLNDPLVPVPGLRSRCGWRWPAGTCWERQGRALG